METDNVDFMQCSCGSTDFEWIRVVKVTRFFEKEYKTGEGFTDRTPTAFSEHIKLKCAVCGHLFGE